MKDSEQSIVSSEQTNNLSTAHSSPSTIRIAKITAAHGIKGFVKMAVYLEAAKDIENHNPLQNAAGEKFTITLKNSTGKFWLAEIDGVKDRNRAEALAGTEFFIARTALPETDEDEIYHSDLIGMEAFAPSGKLLGTVCGVPDFGSGDLLDLGNKVLIPYHDNYVAEIDLENKKIIFTDAAQALIDLLKS